MVKLFTDDGWLCAAQINEITDKIHQQFLKRALCYMYSTSVVRMYSWYQISFICFCIQRTES